MKIIHHEKNRKTEPGKAIQNFHRFYTFFHGRGLKKCYDRYSFSDRSIFACVPVIMKPI